MTADGCDHPGDCRGHPLVTDWPAIPRRCLSDDCGQTHLCRNAISQCVCPFCQGDHVETAGLRRLDDQRGGGM